MERLSQLQINWGKILIWVGVLTWVPYVYLIISGKEASLFPFLALHLIGVVGGLWIKKQKRSMNINPLPSTGKRARPIGNILILLGILAWAPYLILHKYYGYDVDITPYKVVHLTGILAGIFIRTGLLDKVLERFRMLNEGLKKAGYIKSNRV